MNRIDQIFQGLRKQGRKALMPFVSAGDPDVATTGEMLAAMERAGAAICELGIPFSDPIADGPVIQASMTYALDHHVTPAAVLDMVAKRRTELTMGLVAMVSFSIVHRRTPRRFLEECKSAGIDGFIFPDLPLEEAPAVREAIGSAGLIQSMLISPTTPMDRAQAIARLCSGFVYLLARAGITGEQKALAGDLPERIRRLRSVTDLPIAVGFGIATREHVRQVVAHADAAIVGSAIVRRIAGVREQGPAAVVKDVEAFVHDLVQGL